MSKINSSSFFAAFVVTAMIHGHPAYACPDSLSLANEAKQLDRIYSKYKQVMRERKAITDDPNPKKVSFCRLSREMAELEREFLDNRNIVRSSCPALYNSLLDNSSTRGTIELVEHNYEWSQKIIGSCAREGY